MATAERHSGIPAIGRWSAVIGLLAFAPRLGLAQQSGTVHATARVIASPASEHRALVAELARRWARRAGPMRAQGSLALVRLTIVGPATSGMPVKPVAIVDIRYLRN